MSRGVRARHRYKPVRPWLLLGFKAVCPASMWSCVYVTNQLHWLLAQTKRWHPAHPTGRADMLERHLWGLPALSLLCSDSIIPPRTHAPTPGCLNAWVVFTLHLDQPGFWCDCYTGKLQLKEETLPGPSLGVVGWNRKPRCFPCPPVGLLLPHLTSLSKVSSDLVLPACPLISPSTWPACVAFQS